MVERQILGDYWRDGAVCVRNAFDAGFVDLACQAIEADLADATTAGVLFPVLWEHGDDGARDPDGRSSGAAPPSRGDRPGRPGDGGAPRVDRRPHRHDASRQRRGHRCQPDRCRSSSRRHRGQQQSSLPVQADDPVDRRRQPGHRADRRRARRDQRGLSVRPQPARVGAIATSTCACAHSTSTATPATRSSVA